MLRPERALARVTSRAVLAVLLVGGTVAVLEVPASVHADPATIAIVNGDAATTPSTLATTLLAPGETLSGAVTINGSPEFEVDDPRLQSYGTFSDGTTDVGLDSGLIIAANADAASFATSEHVDHVSADRPDLALGNLLETQPGLCNFGASTCIHNATDLSFSLIPSNNFIKFDYSLIITERGAYGPPWDGEVFGYPDGFALFVNGETPANNCAAVPASGAYLTMSTAGIVPPEGNAAANRAAALATVAPNQQFAYAAENPDWTVQFLSVPLTCVVDVTTQNSDQTPVSIRIVVADVNDGLIPPAVLIKAGSVRFEPTASPVWTDFTLGGFQVDTAYLDGVHASGGPLPTYSLTDGFLPAGIDLDETSGAVTGIPTAAGAAYDFTITVTNGILPDLVSHFAGNVAVPPAWTDDEITAPFQVGVGVDDGVAASGTPAPTYSISAGGLPLGLTLDPGTGAITGTPTSGDEYSFTIVADNGVGSAVTQDFSGTVAASPTWIDQTLGPIQFDVAYFDGVSAFGTPVPTYSITTGFLPLSLSLDDRTGEITGTPTAAGAAYDFTITVANGILPDLVAQFTGAVAVPPAWIDDEITAPFQVGVDVDDGVSASGTPAPTYSLSSGAMPDGLSLDGTTGAITGTPTVAGEYDFTISAVNGLLPDLASHFTGTVVEAPTPIVEQPTGGFVAISPVRLLDTRDGDTLVAGVIRHLSIAGLTGVPADASWVVLNLTATNAASAGFITVFSCDVAMPPTSNVNFLANQTVASSVSVALDDSGGVCIFSDAQADVIVDISGAYSPSEGIGRLATVEPYRITDTREDGSRLTAGTSFAVNVAGHGMPDDATAVLLNITVDGPTSAGFVTAYPCGSDVPLTSNLNFVAGQTIANSAVVRIGSNHTVCFYVSADTDLIVDVNGSYSATSSGGFPTDVQQQRLLDTRTTGSAAAGSVQELDLDAVASVPANATAVTLNVTIDRPQEAGFVTVYSCSSERPLASNVNFTAGQTVANSVTATVGSSRTVCVFTTAATDLVIDLNGVYSTLA